MKKKSFIIILIIILGLIIVQFIRFNIYSSDYLYKHKEADTKYICETYNVNSPSQSFILSGGGTVDTSEFDKLYEEYHSSHLNELDKKYENIFYFTYFEISELF